MFIFLSNLPDFCPQLYILLWGRGLQSLVWSCDFVPAEQHGLGRVPVLTLHVIPMPWHTDSWKFISNTVALKAENHNVLRQRSLYVMKHKHIGCLWTADGSDNPLTYSVPLQFLPSFVSLKPALPDSGNQKPTVVFPQSKQICGYW